MEWSGIEWSGITGVADGQEGSDVVFLIPCLFFACKPRYLKAALVQNLDQYYVGVWD
jgi:hypothetical protein